MLLRSFWKNLLASSTRQRRSPRLVRRFERLEARVLLTLTVTVNYSLDTNNFFPANSEQRLVFEAALNDVAANLNDTLLEIVPHKDNPADTWTVTFDDPSTGNEASVIDMILGESEIVVFAGARQLGMTQLGEGGPGSSSIMGTQSFLDLVSARGQAGALGSPNSQTDYSLWGGAITFDIDANWFFGLTTTGLDASLSDFYSVAQHEFAHMLGFGTAASFANLASGTEFNGLAATAEYDFGGAPPLESDQGHWVEGTTDDGREVAMDPSVLQGDRKTLCRLDYAAISDLGWDVTAGAGTGGGGAVDPRYIKLLDGSTHTLVVQDDGIAGNGMSEYLLDGGPAVAFPTDAGNVTVVGGDMSDQIAIASLDSAFTGNLSISGAAGDDAVSFDHAATDAVTIAGGAGSDTVSVTGAAASTVTYSFVSSTAGDVLVADGSPTTVSYSSFEELIDDVASAARVFGFATAGDSVTLQDDGTVGNGSSRLTTLASSPVVTFANPSSTFSLDVGPGNDVVTVGAMDSGFASSILILGADGNDQLSATLASLALTLDGGVGTDTLTGSVFADALLGGPDNDSLIGLAGNDALTAGIGHDTMSGGDGNDALNGGSGNDVLDGGAGNDVLNGSGGIDSIAEVGDANFVLTSTTLTGLGTDSLVGIEGVSLTGGASANTINVSAATFGVTVNGGGGSDSVIGSNFADTINGNSGNDTILPGDGNDQVSGSDGNDSILGALGADSIDGGNGNDTVLGGDGNDTLSGGLGDDLLDGALGSDSLLGGDGRDSLSGGDGNDVVDGEGTDGDSVSGGLGDDSIRGGSGNDVIVESADVNFTLTATTLTGLGTDTLSGLELALLTGGASANTINASGFSGSVTLLGGAGADTLTGGNFADVLSGEAENDSLIGNAGNDSMLGGAGADLLNGGVGNDSLQGQGGSLDTLLGGIGNDVLDGGTGNDKLFGEDGNDTLLGQDGTDFLSGGNNDDSLLGGTGADSLYGEAGNDILNGGADNDVLEGGDGNDGLSGFTGNDIILGGLGTDTIYGGDGNDSLFGGGGNDIVIGGSGSDAVNGNSGTDTLVGGNGTGTADAGDTFGDPAEINEAFAISPLPDWVNFV